MRAPEQGGPRTGGWSRSLAAKFAFLLVASTAALFALFGYLILDLERKHSQEMLVTSADRIGDLIQRSTRYQMLRNDREALYRIIHDIGSEPGIRRVRIFNEYGRISFSTDATEVNRFVDKRGEACYGCHAPETTTGQPLTKLSRPDRARVFGDAKGQRVLGVMRPIENEPACSNAGCHAHPPEKRILGVIDTDLSLAAVDAQLAEQQQHVVLFTVGAVLAISAVSLIWVWLVLHRPIKELARGTRRVAAGDLDFRLPVRTSDELGELAGSFNRMTGELAHVRAELTGWTKQLETRVEQKTAELKRVHEHVVQVEKMASIGKLAAVVAHEINNPLAGILTYTKLLRKWLDRGEWEEGKRAEARNSLELIESESRRCGEIVKNLLTFSRAAPLNPGPTALNGIVERVVRLVQHRSDLMGIAIHLELGTELPSAYCDPAAIEQVLLALVMNAIDAMQHGGNLWLRTISRAEKGELELQVQDDGTGISAEVLPRLFEPFVTTKERGKGVGLGLAISKSIVERHGGRIEVQSEPGRGTRFGVILPVEQPTPVGANEAHVSGVMGQPLKAR